MERVYPYDLNDSDVRFLEYRLDVIQGWPPSPRKHAAAEAISRRLASIARATLSHRELAGLLSRSCSLLDQVFSSTENPAKAAARRAA